MWQSSIAIVVMPVAAAAAAPVVGFDVIADHIYAVHAKAVASDGIANTVAGVFRVVGRKLVSSFTEGMGKRKSSTGTAGANPPPAKRRVSVISTSVTNYARLLITAVISGILSIPVTVTLF